MINQVIQKIEEEIVSGRKDLYDLMQEIDTVANQLNVLKKHRVKLESDLRRREVLVSYLSEEQDEDLKEAHDA
jgi:predicted  nucleic acid-binding Zn-ribbon protein